MSVVVNKPTTTLNELRQAMATWQTSAVDTASTLLRLRPPPPPPSFARGHAAALAPPAAAASRFCASTPRPGARPARASGQQSSFFSSKDVTVVLMRVDLRQA